MAMGLGDISEVTEKTGAQEIDKQNQKRLERINIEKDFDKADLPENLQDEYGKVANALQDETNKEKGIVSADTTKDVQLAHIAIDSWFLIYGEADAGNKNKLTDTEVAHLMDNTIFEHTLGEEKTQTVKGFNDLCDDPSVNLPSLKNKYTKENIKKVILTKIIALGYTLPNNKTMEKATDRDFLYAVDVFQKSYKTKNNIPLTQVNTSDGVSGMDTFGGWRTYGWLKGDIGKSSTESDKTTITEGDKKTVIENGITTITEGDKKTVIEGDKKTVIENGITTITEGDKKTIIEGDKKTIIEGNKTIIIENEITTITDGDIITVIQDGKETIINKKQKEEQEKQDKAIILFDVTELDEKQESEAIFSEYDWKQVVATYPNGAKRFEPYKDKIMTSVKNYFEKKDGDKNVDKELCNTLVMAQVEYINTLEKGATIVTDGTSQEVDFGRGTIERRIDSPDGTFPYYADTGTGEKVEITFKLGDGIREGDAMNTYIKNRIKNPNRLQTLAPLTIISPKKYTLDRSKEDTTIYTEFGIDTKNPTTEDKKIMQVLSNEQERNSLLDSMRRADMANNNIITFDKKSFATQVIERGSEDGEKPVVIDVQIDGDTYSGVYDIDGYLIGIADKSDTSIQSGIEFDAVLNAVDTTKKEYKTVDVNGKTYTVKDGKVEKVDNANIINKASIELGINTTNHSSDDEKIMNVLTMGGDARDNLITSVHNAGTANNNIITFDKKSFATQVIERGSEDGEKPVVIDVQIDGETYSGIYDVDGYLIGIADKSDTKIQPGMKFDTVLNLLDKTKKEYKTVDVNGNTYTVKDGKVEKTP